MNKLFIKLTQALASRYLPEMTDLQEIVNSPAYLATIEFVNQAEKTKSLGIHKREYVQAHLAEWYQKRSIPKPSHRFINLLIELALLWT